MFNRILVPLDGSTLAERVIPHAVQFARIFGSTIVLLQVLDPTSYHENPNPVNPLNWQIRKTEADMYLHSVSMRITDELSARPGIFSEEQSSTEASIRKVEFHIREGKTAENIVNFAHSENIDLLIICSHGSGGLSKWDLSSVTQKVINMIYLPVLLVRAYTQSESVETHIHYRRILLPIDSSRRAESALSAGVALAQGENALSHRRDQSPAASDSHPKKKAARLLLAAVIKPPELPIPEPYPAEIQQLAQKLVTVSRQAVSDYLTMMGKRLDVACDTIFIEDNSVTSAIQELSDQNDEVDLVVLCAHGYTGKSTWPYGSVASNYIEHGTKPVLVIQDLSRTRVKPSSAEKAGGRQA